MPWVIGVLAPGFLGQPAQARAVDDARLMLPYLAFAGPVAVLLGLANAQGRIGLTALSPILFNLTLIGVLIALLLGRHPPTDAALLLSAAVGLAGLLQLSMLASRGRAGASPLKVCCDAPMRGFFARALPGMISNSGPQLLVMIGAIVASAQPSAVSWLYFANRLIELPLGIVGAATGAVLLPELSRAQRSGDATALARAGAHAVELTLGLALPAALGLIVLRRPIVQLLFEHGAFGAADAAATAPVLALLALGLPAQMLVKALAPAFFARDDTGTPLRATLAALGIALAAALALGPWFGASGVAAAIALAAWGHAALLIRARASRLGFAVAADLRRLGLIALAACGMAGLLALKAHLVLPLAAQADGLVQAALLFALIAGGIVVYGGLLLLFGVLKPRDAIRAIRRPPSADLRG
jgi:putative peptidoglycan lipid II flippase